MNDKAKQRPPDVIRLYPPVRRALDALNSPNRNYHLNMVIGLALGVPIPEIDKYKREKHSD